MNTPRLIALHMAALSVACVRGVAEFASLQGWRLRDRLAKQVSSRT